MIARYNAEISLSLHTLLVPFNEGQGLGKEIQIRVAVNWVGQAVVDLCDDHVPFKNYANKLKHRFIYVVSHKLK